MCALAFDYEDAVKIDLGSEVPVLQHRRGWVLAQATLAAIDIRVTAQVTGVETEMTVAGIDTLPLRAASLYAAPQGVTSSRAAGAVFLADIPLGSVHGHVDFSAKARLALSSFLADFNTPFALILSSHVVEESAPVPEEVVLVNVTGRVDASF